MNTYTHNRVTAHLMASFVIALMLLIAMPSTQAVCGIANTTGNKKNSNEEVQRDPPSGAFDQQKNVVSNIDFYTSNYGIFGFNVRQQIGGTFWPRGTGNQYLFAGGAWFAALKRPPGASDLRKRVMITYNPNSGQSWMVPGSIDDGNNVDQSDGVNKNRIYFSTDFNTSDGSDLTHPAFPKWPIWDASANDTLRYNNYYGLYVNNTEERARTKYAKGPAFISQEDIFCVYKDTDLSRYEGGALKRQAEGFPFGLQIEQMIYSWGFGDYADFVFLKYMFIHPTKFTDTLYNCWMAGVMDVDIGLRTNSSNGAQNDRARYYSEEDTLNLAVQWSNSDRGEANQGFGYLGFNFLESPAVDADGFLRKDKKQFPVTEQLGLRTMRNWPIAVDPIENEDRYNFITSQDRDGDQGPGDRRLLMATGPFNMRPGDSARIVVGVILAATATGKDATGTAEDMTELIRKVRFAQFVYNNQFRAPQAPALPVIRGYETTGSLYKVPAAGWLPLNNAIAIQWDSTAEMSVDTLEAGMDFLGYRIYRARRTDLDTFAKDLQLNERKGPLAWKQIAQFGVVPPFTKTSTVIGETGVPIDNFIIADVIKPGQKKILVARTPTFALPWAGYFNDLLLKRQPARLNSDNTLDMSSISKYDSVIFTYFTLSAFDSLPVVNRVARGNAWGVDSVQALAARDTLIKLIQNKKVKAAPILFKESDPDFAPGIVSRPWEETYEVRGKIVAPYLHTITQGRQFYDEGDDDKNGDILYDPDPEQTEKLINNIDYYYAIRPYDEGDYLQATEGKLGLRGLGLVNTVTAMPLASRPTTPTTVEFRVDPQDQLRMGGIYNIKLKVTDDQRFQQLFAGKTLELEFFRNWFGVDHDRSTTTEDVGMYGVSMYLRDSATQAQIGAWSSSLPPQLCGTNSLAAFFTENTVTWVDTAGVGWKVDKTNGMIYDTVFADNGSILRIDTTVFQIPTNMDKILRNGTYTTDAACFGGKYALGTVGMSFDYAIEQWGGAYRSLDSSQVEGGDPNIYVGDGKAALVYNDSRPLNQPGADFTPPYQGWQPSANFVWPASYNNGPGIYEITFEEGGMDTITTSFRTKTTVGDANDDGKIATFENVPYLNMRVRNIAQFERPDVHPDGTISSKTVSYPFDLKNTTFPLTTQDQIATFPNPELVPLDGFAVAAYGWRNPNRGTFKSIEMQYFSADSNNAHPVGDMGRYYVSRNVSRDGADTLYFTHVIVIGGAQFCIDFSRFGGRNTLGPNRAVNANTPYHGKTGVKDLPMPSQDFKPGDKVRFYTFGGAMGFPFDHAKAYAKVSATGAENTDRVYTSEEMEQVQVVPNPYYVTHEGIQSPYQSKLYFTRLPRKCTISIYTTNGDLINTFSHDETTSESPTTYATYVWDLLSKNRQRVASQTLVAKIETPEGASVVRKFTIIVGPARIVTEE